jgi:excinuclease UvrABC nuclease subunit
MKVAELKPLPANKVLFKLSSFKFVPKEAGCYILTTFDDNILYVGLTDNFFVRFQQHLATPQKTNPNLEGKAIWFYYLNYDNKNLPKLERTWLNQYQAMHGALPILNSVNSPIS